MLRVCMGAAALAAISVSTPAEAVWRKATSENFVIYSDGSERQLKSFAEDLEKFRWLLAQGKPVDEHEGSKLTIFLVSVSRSDELYGKGGGTVAGWYSASERGAYAVSERLDSNSYTTANEVLFHEYAHHYMLRYFTSAYPAWFIEGYADINATANFTSNGDIEFGNYSKERAYTLVVNGTLPLRQLMGIEKRGDVSRFYATAWLLTHYLTQSGERAGELKTYLAALNEGKTAEEAVATFTGGIDGLEKDLKRYLRVGKLKYIKFSKAKFPAAKVTLEQLSGADEAMVPLHAMSLIGGREHLKPRFVKAAQDAAKSYPAHADIRAYLCEALYASERNGAALTEAEAVLAKTPDNPRALMCKADILMDRAEGSDGDAAKEADWKAARSAIIRANRAAPEQARPLVMFSDWYSRSGTPFIPIVHDGLEKAFEILPQDDSIRMRWVASLAERGRYGDAAIIMNPVANSPHLSSDNTLKKVQAFYRCMDEKRDDCGGTPDVSEVEETEDADN